MTEVLLPCPFCGGEATFEQVGSVALQEGCAWSVGCPDEECHGFQSVTTYARKRDAATGWNTRAPIDGQAELRAGLEEIVASMADDDAAGNLNWGHAKDALDTARAALSTTPDLSRDEGRASL